MPREKPGQAAGYIRLVCQPGNTGDPFVSFEGFGPFVYLDGVSHLAQWGETLVAVAPGTHTVAAHCQAVIRFGFASTPVRVCPGQTVTVFYMAPNRPYGGIGQGNIAPGWIGFTPPPPSKPVYMPRILLAISITLVAAMFFVLLVVAYFNIT